MASRLLVELPKVASQRLSSQPIMRSYSFVNFAYKWPAPLALTQRRCASSQPITKMPEVPEIKTNLLFKIRRYFGLPDYPSDFYRGMGVFIYEKIDTLVISDILTEFELEDTFYSWYLIMELHLWILLSRVTQNGKEGRRVKEAIGNTMWDDVRRRIKLVDPNISISEQTRTLKNLDEEMQFALILYDEAMCSDDKRLAEALWVRLFRGQDVDPILLEKAVCYVRKQIRHLDLTPREQLILKANYTWLPVRKCRIES